MEIAIPSIKRRSILYWLSGILVLVSGFAIITHWLQLAPPPGSGAHAPGEEWFSVQRLAYGKWPILTQIHLVSSFLFVLIIPFQFSSSLRNRFTALHRAMGKVFIGLTPFVAGSGLVLGVVIPFGGVLETAYSIFLFSAVMYFSYRGVSSIREKKVKEHQVWMTRLFAWSMSIASMRIVMTAFYGVQPFSDRQWFAISLLLGLIINIAVSEWWIYQKRRAK